SADAAATKHPRGPARGGAAAGAPPPPEPGRPSDRGWTGPKHRLSRRECPRSPGRRVDSPALLPTTSVDGWSEIRTKLPDGDRGATGSDAIGERDDLGPIGSGAVRSHAK